MTLQTLIIDDEPLAREGLADYVRQVDFLTLAGQAEDPIAALSLMDEKTVDLLLLDIQMPRLNGLDFLRTLSNPPLVILTTAYPSFALEGYQLAVLDYLVKPITFQRFFQAALRAKQQYELLRKSPAAPGPKNAPGHFFVKADGKVKKISFDELLYAESMQNYVHLYTQSGRVTALLPLKQVEAELPAADFCRVHKSFVANLRAVTALDGRQLVIGETRIPVSRQRWEEVEKRVLGDRLLE